MFAPTHLHSLLLGQQPRMEDAMPHIICEPCIGVKDKSCVDVCPVECIYEADDQFYIHPEECIDCGACIPACPVNAIFVEEDVPEQWHDFIAKNYKLSGLESP
jgi:NAD-dependent dihydropyrimidine dehydrogenase PreA subunit